MYSEFSGYRTSEIACECVVEQCKRHQTNIALESSSADISKTCQKVIASNSQGPSFSFFTCYFPIAKTSGPNSCLFGDILNLLPDDVLANVRAPVEFNETITSKQIQKSLGKKPFKKLLTKQGVLRCDLGNVPRDSKLVSCGRKSSREFPNAFEKAKDGLQAPNVLCTV